ncbi:MAG TPA: VWA domain-containing protein [Blastocatellia bacterium]|nr:VWA domain-containing protein [Blastocatellia bacterium]
MRRSASLALALAALTLLISAAVTASEPQDKSKQPQPPAQQDDTQRIRALEVRLPVTVKHNGKFVTGLAKNNFEVYEDGKRQQIIGFEAPSKLPLNIALLVDTSNSVKLKLPFEKDAGEDFIMTVTTYRRKDQVLLASFDSDVELHQDFTDAQEPLIRALRALKAGGYTRLYDGVYRVIEEKLATVPRADARRVIVVLSDGEDTASERSLRDAIEMAQRYDVTIFGISTKNFKGATAGTVENSDDKDLRKLCEETGGQLLLPSQKIELFRAFTQVAEDLRHEYVLYYRPENQAQTKKHRDIKVKLVGANGDLSHKKGYTY